MSAKDFFLTELPKHLETIEKTFGAKIPKVDYDVEFEIDGEGMYSIAVKNGHATTRRGGAADPLFALKFAKQTWEESLDKIVRPRLSKLDEAEKEIAKQLGGRKPVAPETILAAVKALPLRVELQVSGTSHSFELRTAGAEEDDPTITVSVAESDLDAMIAGTVSVQDAFKQGKLKAKGAVTTAMALLSRVFPA
jgi:putative sterol carrier protein